MGVLPSMSRVLMLNTRPRSSSGVLSCKIELAAVVQVIPVNPTTMRSSADSPKAVDAASAAEKNAKQRAADQHSAHGDLPHVSRSQRRHERTDTHRGAEEAVAGRIRFQDVISHQRHDDAEVEAEGADEAGHDQRRQYGRCA